MNTPTAESQPSSPATELKTSGGAVGASGGASLRVVHFPCESTNSYNRLVAHAVAPLGVQCELKPAPAPRPNSSLLGRVAKKLRIDGLWSDFIWARDEKLVHWHWISNFYSTHSMLVMIVRSAVIFSALAVARLNGTRMVLTVHNLKPHELPHRKLNALCNRLTGILVHRLIVHSPDAVDVVAASFGQRKKIRVIEHVDYGVISTQKLTREQARAQLGLDPARPMALAFGMVRSYKRPECFLAAAPALVEQGLSVVIAGSANAPMSERLKKQVGAQPHVHLRLDYLPDDLLHVYLCAADVAVFCYADSLTSGAAHMALAYDLPLVGPVSVAFAELARLGLAQACDVASPQALAQAIHEAAASSSSPQREAAVREYRLRCSSPEVGKKLLAVYRELVR